MEIFSSFQEVLQNSPFLFGHLMPAALAALARSPSASPKSAQKGQLTRGRRGERGERQEEKREQWERDAAPRRQDLSGGGGGDCDVNEPHCPRMETSNGKPKPLSLSLSSFSCSLPPSKVVVVDSLLTHSLLVFLPSFLPDATFSLLLLLATRTHAAGVGGQLVGTKPISGEKFLLFPRNAFQA